MSIEIAFLKRREGSVNRRRTDNWRCAAPENDSVIKHTAAGRALFCGAVLALCRHAKLHGCVAFEPGRLPLALAAFEVDARDTMGAGDAFASALCMGLCEGLDLGRALGRANAAGAWLASHDGVLDALPHAAQLDSFYASRRIL